MKKVFGYIRVSTVKQGAGVSLQEQKEAIIRYAKKHQLEILQWFEEKETAAKQGRPLFTKMIKLLKGSKSNGVIIHKIDRSARNLKDWATLGDLIDEGVEVHFAHESLDLNKRGGRLAADIQAVIASDYIRNLREEALKGLYGRLRQGVYPFAAPIGYLNNGGGQLKTFDPKYGSLVKKAFELYASGKYNIRSLVRKMSEFGLRNSRGSSLSVSTMAKILKNPFYVGIMKVKGKSFKGEHEPIVSSKLFNTVQEVLAGKTNTKPIKHDFLFRKLIRCAECGYFLIGELQKGHVYYRCHTKHCKTKTIRSERINEKLIQLLNSIQLQELESSILEKIIQEAKQGWSKDNNEIEEVIKMQQIAISRKFDRLTDAYIEGIIDDKHLEKKKEKLLIEQSAINNNQTDISKHKRVIFRMAEQILELLKSHKKSYEIAIKHEKRKLIRNVTSNLTIIGKDLMITMQLPFNDIVKRSNLSKCGLVRDTPRTCTAHYVVSGNKSQQYLNCAKVYQSMQEVFEIIMNYCEVEVAKQSEDHD